MRRKNVHANFVDLNPVWKKDRHQRAVKVANRYLSVVGDQLKEAVAIEQRRLFNEQLKTSKIYKMGMSTISNLNTIYKKDLARAVKANDAKT